MSISKMVHSLHSASAKRGNTKKDALRFSGARLFIRYEEESIMSELIQDFGSKIGGARKDLWASYGLRPEDLLEMNEAERLNYIKKDNVWKRPDYQKMIESGLSARVVYFVKVVRDALPTAPALRKGMTSEEMLKVQDRYVSFVGTLRDGALSLKADRDITGFYGEYVAPHLSHRPHSHYIDVESGYEGLITKKVLAIKSKENFSALDRDIQRKQFGYTQDQKVLSHYQFYRYDGEQVRLVPYGDSIRLEIHLCDGTYFGYPTGNHADPHNWKINTWFILQRGRIVMNNIEDIEAAKKTLVAVETHTGSNSASGKAGHKARFVPPQLAHVRFRGADIRHGSNIEGSDYLSTFHFYGGEFGNWMGEKDRQVSMNMGFESLCVMARALDISLEDISLGGRLSIAFGARGQGSAAAHYEPMREVINLTKMHGAGSLAHEWGHAMDDILAKSIGADGLLAGKRSGLTQEQIRLHNDMMYTESQLSVDEQEKELKSKIAALENQAEAAIRSVLPGDNGLSLTQIERRDELIQSVLSDLSINAMNYVSCRSIKGDPVDSIEALSDWRKTVAGRVLPKAQRAEMSRYVAKVNLQRKALAELKPRVVHNPSQYLLDSRDFDKQFTREPHGYWASECEMFARAFACYVHDKLREQGIVCDYLAGHAECGPIPTGAERARINADFDGLLRKYKQLGLLRDYTHQ